MLSSSADYGECETDSKERKLHQEEIPINLFILYRFKLPGFSGNKHTVQICCTGK